jgi:hypothetical protein
MAAAKSSSIIYVNMDNKLHRYYVFDPPLPVEVIAGEAITVTSVEAFYWYVMLKQRELDVDNYYQEEQMP